jgi:hypothetical protein
MFCLFVCVVAGPGTQLDGPAWMTRIPALCALIMTRIPGPARLQADDDLTTLSRPWLRAKALQTASAWTCLGVWTRTGPVRPVLPDPYRPRVTATPRLQSEILWIIMIIRPDSEVAHAGRPVRCARPQPAATQPTLRTMS